MKTRSQCHGRRELDDSVRHAAVDQRQHALLGAVSRAAPGAWSGTQERGSVLLAVLVLTSVLATLCLQLLTTSATALRSQENGLLLARAQRAAESGVEWATARIESGGLVGAQSVVWIEPGVVAEVTIDPDVTPNVRSRGSAGRVSVGVGAHVTLTPGPYRYAAASFGESSSFWGPLTVGGNAYFGDPAAPFNYLNSRNSGNWPLLIVSGDLDLCASNPPTTNFVGYAGGGVLNLGVVEAAPVWDTRPFLTMSSTPEVPVTFHVGDVSIVGAVLEGIHVFDPSPGGRIEIEDTVLNGCLVVHAPYDARPFDPAHSTELRLAYDVTIEAGTAVTGNLALLAPGCRVTDWSGRSLLVKGVAYVGDVYQADFLRVEGLLLSRGVISTNKSNEVAPPAQFVPDCPLGVTIPPGPERWSIDWQGRF